MKSFRGLFMLLIGMISFTTLASTPVLEQKQKPILVKTFDCHTIVANVVDFDFLSVQADNVFIESFTASIYLKNEFKPNASAVITDVGWYAEKQLNQLHIYKEKLQYNYITDHSWRICKLGIKYNRSDC